MLKIILFLTCIVVGLCIVYFLLVVSPRMGSHPTGQHLETIKNSPQFSLKQDKFINKDEKLITDARKNANYWKMTWEFLVPKNHVTPKSRLPDVNPDINQFIKIASNPKFIWLGHSSILLNINDKTILFDPVFSNHASPVHFMNPRFQSPVLELKDLPRIDYIVISHDHYDHLDYKSILYFKNLNTKFIVPLGIASILENWGINKSRIVELDWWQSTNISRIEFVCTPAQHFSGRRTAYGNKTLWASWVIKTNKHSLYYSGDSGYGDHFKEIGDKLGPFDITFIENGQYDNQWKPVHLHPQETIKAYHDLKSKVLCPIHWGMFNMALHNWYDPIEEISNLSQHSDIELLTPKIGEIVDLGKKQDFEKWWRE